MKNAMISPVLRIGKLPATKYYFNAFILHQGAFLNKKRVAGKLKIRVKLFNQCIMINRL